MTLTDLTISHLRCRMKVQKEEVCELWLQGRIFPSVKMLKSRLGDSFDSVNDTIEYCRQILIVLDTMKVYISLNFFIFDCSLFYSSLVR